MSMRLVIALFLIVQISLGAMEPQKPADKMQISPQELKQEFERRGSYLSLLPKAGISELIEKYAFNSLEETIAAIRAAYLNDPMYKEQFLHDSQFNQAIIDALAERFKDTEPDSNILEKKIALTLNTPASFKIGFGRPQLEDRTIFSIFKKYLDHISHDYPHALEYMRQFSSNISHFTSQPLINLAVILYFFEKFGSHIKNEDELPSVNMTTISQLIRAIDHGNIPQLFQIMTNRDLRPMNVVQQIIVINRWVPSIMTALCNYLAMYLTQILKRESTEYNAYVINSIFSTSSYNTNFEKCFAQKLTGELGKQIVQYIGTRNHAAFFTGLFHPTNMIVSLWNNALNHADPATMIKLLSCFNRDTISEEAYDPFLFDIVESPRTDVTVLRAFVDRFYINYNMADEEGVTVLMHAIKNARFDMVNFFLDKADINIHSCDNNGHNAFSFAGLLPESPERDALIKRLKDMGAEQEGVCVVQ